MKYFLLALSIILLSSCTASSQIVNAKKPDNKENLITNPKLVVGIVVDQMRYDYLTRFMHRYSDDGFKRLIAEGYNFKNNHFNYIPTYTGPGHASIFTGTAPQNHGIISNNWYDKFGNTSVYCVQDDAQTSVGTQSKEGQMSPHRMQTTTFADENRLHTQMRGKSIGVSIKDRGAILPAGHSANAAYWFEGGKLGHWITSSYYMEELPDWVTKFNNSNQAESYLNDWNTFYDIASYTSSGIDLNTYEGGLQGNETASFPYKINSTTNNFSTIKATPFGNSLTTDFAIEAIKAEALGMDSHTDVLTVSYSSTDYVGHNFGVNSVEVEDTYIRLDQDIARLLNNLDIEVGKGNYTVFLTSDHGAVHVPAYLQSVKIPSGYFSNSEFSVSVKDFVKQKFGSENLIKDISNYQVFFDYEVLAEKNIQAKMLQQSLKQFILQQEKIYKVLTRDQLESADFTQGIPHLVQQGYHQKRSGDVVFLLEPAFISYHKTGSTHGSGMQYDTHVPLIFFGASVNQGESTRHTEIIDIAPTISALLGISFPNGSSGKVLSEVID